MTRSISREGCRPASRRNFSASPLVLTLSVCSNSVDESGLERMSARRTTPTVTASFGINDSAPLLANAGNARAATAHTSNFFISKLLSLEAPGSESEAHQAEGGGGEKWSGCQNRSQSLGR